MTEIPQDEKDEKRAYKYPFISAEILSCESAHIINLLFDIDSGLSVLK